MPVTVTLELPDDFATVLGAPNRDLSRTALEALAVEEYRAGRLTDMQFRQILGISRFEADLVLKAHSVWLDYSLQDFDREGEAIRRLEHRASE